MQAQKSPDAKDGGFKRSPQRGTTVTETALVLLLVVVISSGALMALQGPIARLYRMQSTWYSMPFP